MEQAITALIIIFLLLFGALTLAQGFYATQQQVIESWRAMEARIAERARTRLQPVGAEVLAGGDVVEITVRNAGDVKVADLPRWDVILEYGAASAEVAERIPYSSDLEPGPKQWTVRGLYLDAATGAPEAYDPGILNPGEEMVIRVRVSPPALEGTTGVAAVGTPNGVCAVVAFGS